MSKKQMIKQMLALFQNEQSASNLIKGLKDLAKKVLTVEDYEEVFGKKLVES